MQISADGQPIRKPPFHVNVALSEKTEGSQDDT